MTQNEEKADSDQPDSRATVLQNEYVKLVLSHFRLRQALLTDFRWFQEQLKLAREGTHSNRTDIINGLLDYLDRSVPELERAKKHLEEQLDEKTVDRLNKGLVGETTSGLPREKPRARLDTPFPPEHFRPKA